MTIVSWGNSYKDIVDLTDPQLAGLAAVRDAAKRSSGDCFVSKKTATWFDHKTTINSAVATRLEKLGLVEILTTWTGNYSTHRARLTDRGTLALRSTERRSEEVKR